MRPLDNVQAMRTLTMPIFALRISALWILLVRNPHWGLALKDTDIASIERSNGWTKWWQEMECISVLQTAWQKTAKWCSGFQLNLYFPIELTSIWTYFNLDSSCFDHRNGALRRSNPGSQRKSSEVNDVKFGQTEISNNLKCSKKPTSLQTYQRGYSWYRMWQASASASALKFRFPSPPDLCMKLVTTTMHCCF